jgi:hypothetical protein
MLADDRDLIVYEPTLARDLGFLNQRVAEGTASLSGLVLTLPGMDAVALGIGPGWIVDAEWATLEVTARLSATALEVSRLRARRTDAAIPAGTSAAFTARVVTARPQIAAAEGRVLRALGLGGVPSAAVLNPEDLRPCVAMAALDLVFTAAATLRGSEDPLLARARVYRQRAAEALAGTRVVLDLDGDGRADAERLGGVVRLARG